MVNATDKTSNRTMDIENLAKAIVIEMKTSHHALWIDPETHGEQHEFIKLLIEERAEKKARRERINEKVAGSLVLSFILGIVGILGMGILDWIRTHLK